MRSLLSTLVLFAVCLGSLVWYRSHARAEREGARAFIQMEPTVPGRSLEERAAAAQGTALPPQTALPAPQHSRSDNVELSDSSESAAPYRCDGRTRCPQMRSCEEAKWFLQHCPGTKMDGDGDGDPCEDQWCRQ